MRFPIAAKSHGSPFKYMFPHVGTAVLVWGWFHSRTHHASSHNVGYFWLLLRIGTLLYRVPKSCMFASISKWVTNIYQWKIVQHHHIFSFLSASKGAFRGLCHNLPNQRTYYLGFDPFCARHMTSPYLDFWQPFQNILTRYFNTMLVKKMDLGIG